MNCSNGATRWVCVTAIARRLLFSCMEPTLPWSWYSDPEILRRETDAIFARTWQYVGHRGQLAGDGSYFAGTAGPIPVVVTQAGDGEVRAFLNVCRHRGFVVADG